MYSWVTLKDIVAWTGATTSGPLRVDARVPSVSTDSRSLSPGGLFVPIRGETFDGHDFLPRAAERGAVAVLSDRPISLPVPVLLVSDTLRALAEVAENLRNHFEGKVIA